jgi:hypothetical protein
MRGCADMKIVTAALILGIALGAVAGAPQTPAESQPPERDLPTVTFTRNWPEVQPPIFSITVQVSGAAQYKSQTTTNDDQPYVRKFVLSAADRQRVFDLAARLNFFSGEFDFKQHKVAQTGAKTLAYRDPAHHSQTSYNWSTNKDIEELTALFTGISNTLESGRKLQTLMQHDKLGLYQELNAMVESEQYGELQELHLISPTLEEIASNPAYMDIARQKARSLLKADQP